ncbi:MAG: isochorismate synthase [Simkaniaceae bacterium]
MLLNWLKEKDDYPKFYFESEGEVRAVCGALDIVKHVPASDHCYYGGRDFFQKKRKRSDWDGFDQTCFFLPKYSRIERIKPQKQPPPLLKSGSIQELLSQNEHKKAVEAILESSLSKVVLANSFIVELTSPCDPYLLLSSLSSENVIKFAIQWKKEGPIFIGTSPETFYKRSNRHLMMRALAGTCRKEECETAFLENKKERAEFDFVLDNILKVLSPFSSKISHSPVVPLETASLRHLSSMVTADLDKSITDEMLIEILHPTAALGGIPKKGALNMIQKLEPFDRGWYGAPIGYCSKEKAHFAVAIRSALVKQKSIQLFAGGGIVQGSKPEKEWNEINEKISQFIKVLK